MLPLLPLLALPLAALGANAATTCNGDSALCDKSYGSVTFVGAHDSYAVGSSVADNQDKDVTQQLTDGIRTLQIQTHNATDGIHVCHTSCSLLDGGTLESYLQKVASWISSNPNDVVTLVMVNIDSLPPTSFSSVFESTGLASKAYSPSSASLALSDWPTLGTLIDAGTPLVTFMDYQADFTSVPYIIDEFSNMFEDAYDVTASDWGCGVNRTSGTAGSQLMLVNHFLDTTYTLGGTQFFVPNKAALNTTNAATGTGSIGEHVTNCQSIWGRAPNHILLDFYDSNGLAPFQVAASLNGVSAPTNSISPYTATATASQSAAAVSTKAIGGARASIGSGAGWVRGWVAAGMGVALGGYNILA